MVDSLGRSPLAELHVHLGGCIGHETCLEMLLSCPDPRWAVYEESFEAAYDASSRARGLVARVAAGDIAARDEFRDVFEFQDGDGGQFAKFQAKFNLLLVGDMAFRCLREDVSIDDGVEYLRPVIESIHRKQREQGLAHVETRLFVGDSPPARAQLFFEGILDIIAALQGPPKTQLVVSLNRADPMALWPRVADLALGARGEHLVGVDFCHAEEGFPPKGLKSFLEAFNGFNQAHSERRLSLVYHVGESFDDKSLESAVRWVVESALAGVHRLGHAIALGVHPDHYGPHRRTEPVSERRDQIAYDLKYAEGLRLHGVEVDERALRAEQTSLAGMDGNETIEVVYDAERLETFKRRQRFAAEQVRETRAIIEVCPSSNRRIAGILNDEHHPIHRFAEWGLPFIIASDDPGLFGVTLEEEIESARKMLSWSREQMAVVVERAWEHRSELASGRRE